MSLSKIFFITVKQDVHVVILEGEAKLQRQEVVTDKGHEEH